jgi:hypothetical protein
MKNSKRVSIGDIEGIKLICDETEGWLRIIPYLYVEKNAYYRMLEDKEDGQPVKPDEEYIKLAMEMFRDIGLSIVDNLSYQAFCVQEICSCHHVIRFEKNESEHAISSNHNQFFKEHPLPSSIFKSRN